MKSSLLVITLIALAVGILGGSLIVLLIQIRRRRQNVDSLISAQNLMGLIGTVEIPFDRYSRGKVRVMVKGSIVELSAITDEERAFAPGDRIFVTDVKGNRALVVSATTLED
ncbi:MAG: NfeD-like protein [Cyanobacteria bacterium RM1_2_2]|nr:NfeD-like protein [Cyanobacteria bacterium RM1_2_2]